MHQTARLLALEVAGVVVAVAGFVDAVRSGSTAAAVFFALLGSLGAVRAFVHRRTPLGLRPDHWTWLRQAAAVTGEPVELIVDRAVDTYRRNLGDDH